MKSHRETYPEQYSHPLCGQQVMTQDGITDMVERVVPSMFGPLAILRGVGAEKAYAVRTLEVIEQK